MVNPVRPDGTYDERIGPYAGRWVKDADPDLIEDLRGRGRLLRAETYEHSYPHCWRCGTPLLYYAKPSWYIATSQIKDRLLASNETVNWHPAHVKHGRFGNWLEGNVDWALSRERYWGTPLPVWRCDKGRVRVIGSLTELRELSGVELEDPHRPFVDEVTFPCENCGGEMRRVPEVIDVWFDSGSMPFAQFHAPHENLEHFEQRFPADFICEALDQTRGWFYSLLAISTLLFDRSSYRNVVCLGLILDDQGRKMSKSLRQHGRAVGRDRPLRRRRVALVPLHLQAAVGRLPVLAGGRSARRVRQFLLQLWNTYAFYVLYANANDVARDTRSDTVGPRPLDPVALPGHDRDRPRAARRLRRDRRRTGDPGVRRRALQLVRAPLAARVLGRIAGRVRDAADVPGDGGAAAGAVLSVHRRRDLRQPRRLRAQRAPVRLPGRRRARPRARAGDGRRSRDGAPRARRPRRRPSSRSASRCARRWWSRPASSARRSSGWRRPSATSSTSTSCGSCPRPTSSARSSSSPTTGRSAPGSASQMPLVAAAVAGLDAAHAASALRDGQSVSISVAGHDHDLTADDLLVSMKPLEGYQVEREGSHAVALELEHRRRAARRGLGARHRARDPERAPGRRARGLRPDRADARRRPSAARCGAHPPGLHRRRDARDQRQLRRIWTALCPS